jgi:hypothetical protein
MAARPISPKFHNTSGSLDASVFTVPQRVADMLLQLPATVSTAQQMLHRHSVRHTRRVDPVLEELFPGGGLEPGALYECRGDAAVSLACALVAASTTGNAWTCFFHLSSLNMQAVSDLGVALHRVVLAQCSAHTSALQQAHVLGALVEGFDVVIAQSPSCSPSIARSIAARAQRHGTTLLLLGKHSFSVDATIKAQVCDWSFSDRLLSRKVHLSFHDRRTHQARNLYAHLPNSQGSISRYDISDINFM